MITFEQSGDFDHLDSFLKNMSKSSIADILKQYGQAGVSALSSATPSETGKTAASWGYSIKQSGGNYTISWTNSNTNGSVNIAILLQYGHGTGTGGYVQGRDYINPAIRPIFDEIAEGAWKAVVSA